MKYDIGSKIRRYRESKGLSQKEFAAQVGVTSSRVSNWELGINRPDVDLLAVICKVLQISADELLEIHLPEKKFSEEEFQIITQYREKPEMRKAVRTLLGIAD